MWKACEVITWKFCVLKETQNKTTYLSDQWPEQASRRHTSRSADDSLLEGFCDGN